MANTGKQRSITIEIDKTVNNNSLNSYPRTYDGKLSFSFGGVNFPEISEQDLAYMQLSDYQTRLDAYKSYVQSIEPGIDINASTELGHEAYRENLTVCPIN